MPVKLNKSGLDGQTIASVFSVVTHAVTAASLRSLKTQAKSSRFSKGFLEVSERFLGI